ncbi:MAG TPA: sulfurtransferase [Chitinophagaceae bacterium]|nr:sulfurtransferase [Chitinophagaceae bacterium]
MFGLLKNLFFSEPDTSLVQAIQDGALLVDVRSPSEFASGSVKGSVNIPLDTLPNQLAKLKGCKSVVVFCRSGARSSQAKGFLDQKGIPNVFNGGTWNNVQQLLKVS